MGIRTRLATLPLRQPTMLCIRCWHPRMVMTTKQSNMCSRKLSSSKIRSCWVCWSMDCTKTPSSCSQLTTEVVRGIQTGKTLSDSLRRGLYGHLIQAIERGQGNTVWGRSAGGGLPQNPWRQEGEIQVWCLSNKCMVVKWFGKHGAAWREVSTLEHLIWRFAGVSSIWRTGLPLFWRLLASIKITYNSWKQLLILGCGLC